MARKRAKRKKRAPAKTDPKPAAEPKKAPADGEPEVLLTEKLGRRILGGPFDRWVGTPNNWKEDLVAWLAEAYADLLEATAGADVPAVDVNVAACEVVDAWLPTRNRALPEAARKAFIDAAQARFERLVAGPGEAPAAEGAGEAETDEPEEAPAAPPEPVHLDPGGDVPIDDGDEGAPVAPGAEEPQEDSQEA